jgi:hypothetical protein
MLDKLIDSLGVALTFSADGKLTSCSFANERHAEAALFRKKAKQSF